MHQSVTYTLYKDLFVRSAVRHRLVLFPSTFIKKCSVFESLVLKWCTEDILKWNRSLQKLMSANRRLIKVYLWVWKEIFSSGKCFTYWFLLKTLIQRNLLSLITQERNNRRHWKFGCELLKCGIYLAKLWCFLNCLFTYYQSSAKKQNYRKEYIFRSEYVENEKFWLWLAQVIIHFFRHKYLKN